MLEWHEARLRCAGVALGDEVTTRATRGAAVWHYAEVVESSDRSGIPLNVFTAKQARGKLAGREVGLYRDNARHGLPRLDGRFDAHFGKLLDGALGIIERDLCLLLAFGPP